MNGNFTELLWKPKWKLRKLCALLMEVLLLWLQWPQSPCFHSDVAVGKGPQEPAFSCLSPQVRKRQHSIDWMCNGVKVSLLLFLSQLVKAIMKRSEKVFLPGPEEKCHKCPICHWLAHWPWDSIATSPWHIAHQKHTCWKSNITSFITLKWAVN